MAIERTTKRNSHIWNDQITVRRARESEPGVTFIVVWSFHQPTDNTNRHYHTKENKPTNRLSVAQQQYEKHKKTALFVEILQYQAESITVVRRFCNLEKLQEIDKDIDWVLKTDNPPYELE